jgi:hypothetical protein
MVLPQNLPYISDETFCNCDNLKDIVIPKSVKAIGYNVFYACDSLKNVYYTGTQTEWNTITKNNGNDVLRTATIHYNYVPE